MDMFGQIWDWFCGLIQNALDWLIGLLPSSPFHALDNSGIAEYLPTLNWFLPIDFMISTLELWLIAVSGYYVYSVFLRWIKAIKG